MYCPKCLLHRLLLLTQTDKTTDQVIDAAGNRPEGMALLQSDTSPIISIGKKGERGNDFSHAFFKLTFRLQFSTCLLGHCLLKSGDLFCFVSPFQALL